MFLFYSCLMIFIFGIIGLGKMIFVKKFIENLDIMFEFILLKKVLYCYGVY